MSQIFHRSANTIAKVSIFGAVFFVAGLLGLFDKVNRSSWMTGARVAREQPIQFSHERHVAGNGIDCRYCHSSVEDSPFAGIPPTKTCMNCHSQILEFALIGMRPNHGGLKNGLIHSEKVPSLSSWT